MDGGKEICCSPLIPLRVFHDGDLVHVFEGTGVGKVDGRGVGWFGRVVGREGDTYLVRNRILSAKGSPSRVDGQYLKLQRDFTLGSGSEQRVHFRTLSKRTRERLLASADEQNNDMRNQAERALAHVKKQKTQESQAHLLRREQITQQGEAAMQETKSEYDRKLVYWQAKCDTLEKQKKMLTEDHKTTLKKKEVFNCLVLSCQFCSCLVYFCCLSCLCLCGYVFLFMLLF